VVEGAGVDIIQIISLLFQLPCFLIGLLWSLLFLLSSSVKWLSERCSLLTHSARNQCCICNISTTAELF